MFTLVEHAATQEQIKYRICVRTQLAEDCCRFRLHLSLLYCRYFVAEFLIRPIPMSDQQSE